MTAALVVVDMQNDFVTGSLPVPGAADIIPRINAYIKYFESDAIPVFMTKDWHKGNHPSFKEHGGPWPAHCIMYTDGANPPPELHWPFNARTICKGINEESYSAFDDKRPHFDKILKLFGITDLFVCGVATDYCVKATVLDALKAGFHVTVMLDAIAAVSEYGGREALCEMEDAGAEFDTVAEFI
jgi:nicotinamidase/pyrazinamidase